MALNPGVEASAQFEKRKQDHIRLSLDSKNEAIGGSGLERIELVHEALPEINFDEVSIETEVLNEKRTTPLFISSMTAGHFESTDLNVLLAKACERRGWLMGVGSQRRELDDPKAQKEWSRVRKSAPKAKLLGNLGLSQLIHSTTEEVQRLVDALEAEAMIIHLNPLQECMQPEGTPQFKGGLQAITKLCKALSVPVVVKETGCGISGRTLARLNQTGVSAVDVSGFGGTHWGRIEGQRSKEIKSVEAAARNLAAQTFSGWGISTLESVAAARKLMPLFEIWASGGVRSGLDVAKLLALGVESVGLAKPILEAALQGEDILDFKMSVLEYELKTAMFCTGSKSVDQLRRKGAWRLRKT